MLIESAFFKLLHIWTAQERIKILNQTKLFKSHDRTFYEAQVASEFANLVMNELSDAGVHIPESFVIQNCPYPDDSYRRVDVKVSLHEYFDAVKMLPSYISKNNFIEVKLFAGGGTEAKTYNIGSILNDMLRLELLTKTISVKHKDSSKYMIVCFDNHPKNYLAYNRGTGGRRQWIGDLLIPSRFGENIYKQAKGNTSNINIMPVLNFSGRIELDLSDTSDIPGTMFDAITHGLDKVRINRTSIIQIPFVKYTIFPFTEEHQAYLFLIRIFNITIKKASKNK